MARSLFPGAPGSAVRTDDPSLPQALARSRAKLAGTDFYYSVLFAPPDRRAALTSLYALWREIDEIAEECTEPAVAAHKLGWWREEIDAIFAGQPRHPAAVAFQACARNDRARAPLLSLHAAVAESVASPGFDRLDALLDHARVREGALVLVAAQLLGVDHPVIANLGAGLRVARLVAGLGADVRRGRLDLPRMELARRGLEQSTIRQRRSDAALREVLADLHRRALPLLALPTELPPRERMALAPLAAPAAIARALLAEVERDGYRVLDHAVVLTPLHKLWIAWKSYRAARRS